MGNIRAATVPGRPCTKKPDHIQPDGTTVRYAGSSNCVACAHEYAADQTRRNQELREAERLRRKSLTG